MTISNELLLGLIIGAVLVLLFQQGMKLSSRLMSPGCLIPISLAIALFFTLIAVGVIDFQFQM